MVSQNLYNRTEWGTFPSDFRGGYSGVNGCQSVFSCVLPFCIRQRILKLSWLCQISRSTKHRQEKSVTMQSAAFQGISGYFRQNRQQFTRPAPDLPHLPPNYHPFATRRFSAKYVSRAKTGIRIVANKLLIYRFFLFCIQMSLSAVQMPTKKGASTKAPRVRIKGLEPPRLSASDPKSDVATNYTISA